MHGKLFLVSVGVMIGGLTFSTISVKVDAQSTVDDSALCESSKLDEAVNLIREGFNEMKNIFGSHQEDLNAACASNQQTTSRQAFVSALLCE